MGQTLTHGIYLPDEGERNCYAGLASNWSILDNAVGTVAEHTTQIAGKAPLVHTHAKADITDFPVYGTTAGTICEGNDSRLSDARTPVAHTHGKSEITDLLNSNFIPSANNTYDLGSSSYQWNNLYAKNYYYNGVAWGLDKYNTWTNSQVYKLTGAEVGSTTSGYIALHFQDKNNANLGFLRASVYSDGRTCFSWKIYNTDNNSQSISSSLEYYITKTDAKVFAPVENGEVNLGDSTHKWKSLNGVNPGALSLPSGGTIENTDWFDISGSILPTGGDATNFTGGANYFTPSKDGWLALAVVSCDSIAVWVSSLNYGLSVAAPDANVNRQLIIPVVAGKIVEIKVKGTRWHAARLIVTQGNV